VRIARGAQGFYPIPPRVRSGIDLATAHHILLRAWCRCHGAPRGRKGL
jgi:hypothetical protein